MFLSRMFLLTYFIDQKRIAYRVAYSIEYAGALRIIEEKWIEKTQFHDVRCVDEIVAYEDS